MSNLVTLVLPLVQNSQDTVCTTPAECANQGVGNFVGTPDRIWATIAALVSLVGLVIGVRALSRSRRGTGNGGRKGAIVALGAGVLGTINGAVNLLVADGGPGTGNGVVGGTAALLFGLIAAVLGTLALTRTRDVATS